MKAQLEEDTEVKHPKTMIRQRSTSVVASESDREVSDQHSEGDTSEEEIEEVEITDTLRVPDGEMQEEAIAAPPSSPIEDGDEEPATADGSLAPNTEAPLPAAHGNTITETVNEMWHKLGLDDRVFPPEICGSALYALLAAAVAAGAYSMFSDHTH